VKLPAIPVTGIVLVAMLQAACMPAQAPPEGRQIEVAGTTAAIVNGDPIYLADVELEAAAQGLTEPGEAFSPGHADYQTVLDQLIDQRLMAQEAVARGLHEEPNARRRLNAARERVLGNILVESLVARNVTDERIREMYSEQVALQQIDDEVRLRHILLDSQTAAERALERIRNGADFTTVAFEESLDKETRIEGGARGYVAPNQMGDPFASIIGDTETGAVSQPFKSEQGWHLIKVEERRTPPPKTLREMRPELVTFLTYTEISRILKDLRSQARIEPGSVDARAAKQREQRTDPGPGSDQDAPSKQDDTL